MRTEQDNFSSDDVNWIDTIEEIHDIAREKGFWNSMDSVLEKMKAMKSTLDDSSNMFTEQEIIQVQKAFIAQKIMLIVTELSESIESDRKSRIADWIEYQRIIDELKRDNYKSEFVFVSAFEGAIKDTFEDEIADAIIRIFDLCAKVGIDIIKHIKYKMEYNKTRDKLHGKEY